MSDLEPRRRSGPSRRSREKRAYTLVLATGGLTVLTFVLVVLAIATSVSLGWAIITALLTAGSAFLLRRTMSS